ncbi:hypothetical protein [Liquorilactobacillus nagelii]|jgi:virulence-associated protein VapD|uniref:hypothetical protein n=1 Tax=Liquorilactobacillus nagelii TaxID=82688 RepID=UPI0006EF7280|nr:hypothetical protein [Liquorilactobacillus nagelii]KRL39883.1 hypothetical protein FD45_GL000059 [Liquorilactobacillus nagelii DSM 13675]QYH53402.1 hypothetical protein G6O73_01295 [Liquorilactobacillus nagelii DSM 13675]
MDKPYIISYDLDNPGQKYDQVEKIIKSFGGAYIKIQGSVWLVRNSLSPEDMCTKLEQALDKNDCLFVCELVKNYQGLATDDQWKFIRENIFS